MNPGPPPFGFRWHGRRLVREPGRDKTLVRIFELFVEKRSKAAVAKELNKAGFRTSRGSKWTDVAVLRSLTGEAAIGRHFTHTTGIGSGGKRELRPRSEWVEFRCEPIITPQLWEKVQQILEAQRDGIPVPRESATPGQVFDGLLICVCGSQMKSDSDEKRYHCSKCNTAIEAADLEGVFEVELLTFLESRWETFSELLGGNAEMAAARERLNDQLRSRAERAEERERIEDLYLKKRIDYEKFGEMDSRAKEDMLEIEVEIRKAERTIAGLEKLASTRPPAKVPGIEELRQRWRRLGTPARQTIASTLVDSLILDGTHITFSYKFPSFVEDAVATQRIEKPTNHLALSGSDHGPRYLRLPKSGSLCALSGLTRSKLNQLILPCKHNGFRPPVKSIKAGGTRLISWESLRKYLDDKLEM